MSRIETMVRFEEPEEEEIVAYCEACNEDLCCGSSVYKFDGTYFCSIECIIDWVGAEEVVLSSI